MGTTRRLLIGFLAAGGVPAAVPGQPPAATDFASDRAVQPPAAVIRAATLVAPIPDKLPAPKAPVAAENTLPIDLPAALRLANAANPTVAIAQVRVREALARVDQAEAQWLPTPSAGGIYPADGGLSQNRKADCSGFPGRDCSSAVGVTRLDLGDALYQPLVAVGSPPPSCQRLRPSPTIPCSRSSPLTSLWFRPTPFCSSMPTFWNATEQILKAARSGEGLIRTAADVHRARQR